MTRGAKCTGGIFIRVHRIDLAMTFLPNEAAQMKSLGFNVETLAVGDYLNLVPPGVATGDKTIAQHPEMQIVANQAADWDATKAHSVTSTILKQNPDLCGIYDLWEVQADPL